MKQTKCKKILSLLLCFVLIAAMALTLYACSDQPEPTPSAPGQATVLGEGSTTFSFSVVDADGKQSDYLIHTDQTTVGQALLDVGLIEGEEGDYGLYVKTVAGITADYAVDGRYWAFYVDGDYAMSGVDVTEIMLDATYSFRIQS